MVMMPVSPVPYDGPLLASNVKHERKLSKPTDPGIKRLSQDPLNCVVSYLNFPEVVALSKTCRDLHNVKEKSLRGRSDVLGKYLQELDGDMAQAHPEDLKVLQAVSHTFKSLSLSQVHLTKEKLQ